MNVNKDVRTYWKKKTAHIKKKYPKDRYYEVLKFIISETAPELHIDKDIAIRILNYIDRQNGYSCYKSHLTYVATILWLAGQVTKVNSSQAAIGSHFSISKNTIARTKHDLFKIIGFEKFLCDLI